jgi:hypothetical protein
LAEEAQVKGRATGAGRYTPRTPPSTAPTPSSRSAPYATPSSKPVSNVSNTKKLEPATSTNGSSMSSARNRDMNCRTCGGKGHFKRDFIYVLQPVLDAPKSSQGYYSILTANPSQRSYMCCSQFFTRTMCISVFTQTINTETYPTQTPLVYHHGDARRACHSEHTRRPCILLVNVRLLFLPVAEQDHQVLVVYPGQACYLNTLVISCHTYYVY